MMSNMTEAVVVSVEEESLLSAGPIGTLLVAVALLIATIVIHRMKKRRSRVRPTASIRAITATGMSKEGISITTISKPAAGVSNTITVETPTVVVTPPTPVPGEEPRKRPAAMDLSDY